ncbi:MAG TPA: tRNA (adenosine(37)-N6)-threonylcarbamoyltransferase complex transferase subunit TsaD [Candidatus Saccharimonadales bacterium]|nr:tRNA (adenosine(37)-N6)-threonylcarbamoyltransferase complex transferase subunit TsaD [Candidatus Saccharimonadales bacterium]
MTILGIETSCDETAAAVVEDGQNMLSNVVASSVDLHKAYGGVVPEIAARSHLEVITPVIEEALTTAKRRWSDIDAIAVTQGPGLAGSLLIGVVTAKSLAMTKNKPLYPINHVEAHIYANFITGSTLAGYQLLQKAPALPLLALIISGGHSHLIYLEAPGKYQVIGRTLDDAVGEAFDKVAKLLGLPYPGGPSISHAAERGNASAYKLPKAHTDGPYDFSFSGLKTAVLRTAQTAAGHDFSLPSTRLPALLTDKQKVDLAASFQATALETLVDKLAKAVDDFQPASVVIGGGVAANKPLRALVTKRLKTEVEYADPRLCTDNGAMIAGLAFFMAQAGPPAPPASWDVEPNLAL